MHKCIAFVGFFIFISCKNSSASDVAIRFLDSLYKLNYGVIANYCDGEALLQAEIFVGRLSELDLSEQKKYSDVSIKILDIIKSDTDTIVKYKLLNSSGDEIFTSSLTLIRVGMFWKVVSMERSLLPALSSIYNK